jgi:hypothetical protein
VEEGTELSDESVVGDECHLIGEKPSAARGHLGVGRDDLDEYPNLVLLCKVHHKLVDDQPETYPVERLREMKAAHEKWVQQTLGSKPSGKLPHLALLTRMQTGKELCNLLDGAHAFLLDHDEPETVEEAKLIGGFLQIVQDLGDIWSDMESSEHVETSFSLTKELKEVEGAGFLVFGTAERRRMRSGDKVFDCPTVVVTVVRPTNKGITHSGNLLSLILN